MLEKKYNAKLAEEQIQKYWAENETFKFEKDDRKIFSIDNPPPTVSGKLHIGHIFSYTQTEMVARFRRMKGENVYYPFGFDDNGLPSERLVEKETGILAKNLPRSEFAKKCKETVAKYEKEFKDLWISLGFSVDWNLQYETINDTAQRVSQRSFLELLKAGKAYRKDMPVLWCTTCQTSIAQAELDTAEIDSTFNWLRFSVEGKEMLIATTRPEMLGGCVAVLVNPDDDRYKDLVGKEATVPLYGFKVPIISDEKVGIDKGTGIVMCCTFGDSTDLEWYEKYNFPYKKVVTSDGKIDEKIEFIGGMSIKGARKTIIELLDEKGFLLKSEPISHIVNTHERCGTDVEIIPSKQWYIDILSEKEMLLKAADDINWYPASMKNRYINWVENLKWDWCISRQRYFGVPIPVWYCKDCGKVILPDYDMLPVNPLETQPENFKCECGCTELIPEDAVMDTWATSSTTPLINAKWCEEDERDYLYPMTVRSQAHEIIRTWAFYTIVKSMYHRNTIPWEDIMISGFVLAKKGEKISKSKGNAVVEPAQLISEYSADAVRYWAANNRLGTDTWFSVEDVMQSKRFITKLWNAAKFSLMHLEDFDPTEDVEILPVDKWILNKLTAAQNQYYDYMMQYEVGLARKAIDDFFWHDYCDDYIEIVKERVYRADIHGVENRKSAQKTIMTVFFGILKLYSVFVPHICEFIYLNEFKKFFDGKSICDFRIEKGETDSESLAFGEVVSAIVGEVRKYKSLNQLSMKTELDEVNVTCDEKFIPLLETVRKDFDNCLSAKKLTFSAGEPRVEIVNEIKENEE